MPDWERKYMGRWKKPNNDYILRSDAVSAFCGNCEGTEVCGQLGEPCEEIKRIKAIPAADVEPVIRCRDCKNSSICDHGKYMPVEGDFFCAYGAKRDAEPPKGEENADKIHR